MAVEYDTDSTLDQELENVLGNENYNEFGPLREHNVEVKACFVRNLNGDGELQPPKGQIVNLKKVPAYFKPYCEDLTYLIVVDEYGWREASADAKRAMMHKALMGIEVAVSSSGEVKLKGRKPDVVEYGATVSRFGIYDSVLESFQTILRNSAARGATQAAREITGGTVEIRVTDRPMVGIAGSVTRNQPAARLENTRSRRTRNEEANVDSDEEV